MVETRPYSPISGRDLRGQRNRHLGPGLGDDLCRRLLVGGIGIGVQETDGYRLHLFRAEPVQGVFQLGRHQRRFDLAVEAHAFAKADTAITRHQRFGKFDEHVIKIVAQLGSSFEHIAKPARGEERGCRALALDHGVGRERRAMHDRAHRRVARVGKRQDLRHRRQHGLAGLVRCRQQFCRIDATGSLIEPDHIGKCAADVDANGNRLFVFQAARYLAQGDARWRRPRLATLAHAAASKTRFILAPALRAPGRGPRRVRRVRSARRWSIWDRGRRCANWRARGGAFRREA